MTDRDQTIIFSLNGDNGEPDRLGGFDDFAATENRPADFVPGLVSLGFINAALRRSKRVFVRHGPRRACLSAPEYTPFSPSIPAAASVLVTLGPYEDLESAAVNNQAMAETLRWLGSLCIT